MMIYLILFGKVFKLNPFRKDADSEANMKGYTTDDMQFGILRVTK